ncbi:MAG: glycosyltransferase family 2 protein [Burkholderiales bacterium]|nr:glycosyltransferase family 2 protein [Bacteroidia bacterium]
MIHIVIPVFNRWRFTEPCILSLLRQTHTDFKIIVADHGSTDGTSEKIKDQFPQVILLKGDESMWWTAATNMGVKYALENGADYVLTLNNDLVVMHDYLNQLINAAQKNLNTIIGSVSLNKNDTSIIVFAGVKWNTITAKYKPSININLSYTEVMNKYTLINTDMLPGRGTLIPVSVFKKIGLFDEVNFPHYAADEDFSLRAFDSGYHLAVATKAAVLSEIDATGLTKNYKKKGFFFWRDTFFSMKSPNKLSNRWLWAKKHAKVPFIYFLFDVSRIVYSQIKK